MFLAALASVVWKEASYGVHTWAHMCTCVFRTEAAASHTRQHGRAPPTVPWLRGNIDFHFILGHRASRNTLFVAKVSLAHVVLHQPTGWRLRSGMSGGEFIASYEHFDLYAISSAGVIFSLCLITHTHTHAHTQTCSNKYAKSMNLYKTFD